ncbi:hypothetical protein THIOKS12070035 [Thiocapsa sp. KS1]|nr:hypothetical protein THIOKS12070035 [Thiocapsa sp. KS1]
MGVFNARRAVVDETYAELRHGRLLPLGSPEPSQNRLVGRRLQQRRTNPARFARIIPRNSCGTK